MREEVLGSDCDILAEVGIFLVQRGDYAWGLDILERCCCQKEKQGLQSLLEWYFYQGVSHLNLKNYEQAGRYFELCVEGSSQTPQSIYLLAISKVMAGQLACAQDLLLELLNFFKEDAAAWFLLGKVHEARGRLMLALHCFKQAIGLRPDFTSAQIRFNAIIQKKGLSPKFLFSPQLLQASRHH